MTPPLGSSEASGDSGVDSGIGSAGSDSPQRHSCQLKVDSLTLALQELSRQRQAAAEATRSELELPDAESEVAHKRSSSLKSKKSPPGSPQPTKKVVRFADALGLDLELVRHVFDAQSPPQLPSAAARSLRPTEGRAEASDARPGRSGQWFLGNLTARAQFAQPDAACDLPQRVSSLKVSLERAAVAAGRRRRLLTGRLRVANVAFEKDVCVRVSCDNWRSFRDTPATFAATVAGGDADVFVFGVDLPPLRVGDCVAFCLRFRCAGSEFWDSNHGSNYCFQVC